MYDLIVRHVKFSAQGEQQDVGICDGLIVNIADCIAGSAKKEIEACGNLMLPPFVESHTHLDTALTAGDPVWNESGTLAEGIRVWMNRKQSLTLADVQERARRVLRHYVTHGVNYIRTHADISDPQLTGLKALLELREQVAPHITLQVIAFPQDGVWNCPANQHRLVEAIHLGADGIGAIPHREDTREDGVASLAYVFDLAMRHDKRVHVLCDEADSGDSRYLEEMAKLTIQTGLGANVTASHAIATSYYSDDYFDKIAHLVERSAMNVVICPLVNTMMQSRFDAYPKGRGIARMKELWQCGVNVSIAHDDMMSPFYPFGSANLLQAAFMGVHLGHMSSMEEIEEALRMITVRGAKTLQIEDSYGLQIGKPANFNILPYTTTLDLLRYQPKPSYVVSRGQVIAETPQTTSQLYF